MTNTKIDLHDVRHEAIEFQDKTLLIIMKNYHTEKWFHNRIGKRVYRNWHKCCNQCDDIAKDGLVIRDKQHATYLYDIQNDFGNEGTILNYRDIK